MPGTYMADIDIGELLLNFVMHKCMQPYAGVDFTLYFPKEWANGWKLTLWERWVYKLRTLDGHIAPDFFVYVDDVHSTGFNSRRGLEKLPALITTWVFKTPLGNDAVLH
jgi:hypothetical protein